MSINIKDRFSFRVWDIHKNRYLGQGIHSSELEEEEAIQIHFPTHINPSYLLACDDYQVIEQCTGLRDKNGKLIFDGDILRSPYGAIRTVRWVSNAGCFMSFPQETMSGPVLASAFNVSVIVGNVHEGIKEKK